MDGLNTFEGCALGGLAAAFAAAIDEDALSTTVDFVGTFGGPKSLNA